MGKKWFAILFACLLSLVFAGCGREQMKAAPKARNRLIVATCPTFKPFEFKNDHGEYEGYEIDLVRAIAGELGMAVEFKDMPFYQALDYVKEGKADIAAASIIVTEERAKKVNFTIPYNVTDMVIIVKEGSSYRAEDMQGSPAAVEKGSVYEEYARSQALHRQAAWIAQIWPDNAPAKPHDHICLLMHKSSELAE